MKRSVNVNKKHLPVLIVLLTMAIVVLVALAVYMLGDSGKGATPDPADAHAGDPIYEMEITPYYTEGALRVRQTVLFVNGNSALDRLVFCLPLNAYRRSATAPLDTDEFNEAFSSGYAPGGLDFSSITVDGREVPWGVSGTSEAILTLLCDVAPGQQVRVEMEYHALIPEFAGAGGFDDDEWRLTGFYPYLARLEGDVWTAYAPGYIGQYLCAPVGDYRITLHAQDGFDVAATGSARALSSEGGWITWSISAPDAREVGIVMRRGACVYEREVNGVLLRIYGRSRLRARRTLDVAAALFERMSAALPYPYPVLEIVMGDYAGRDQSITGLILIDSDAADFEAQLAYLIARQWWGSLVGCDPREEPWLSEALAQFSALTAAREAGLNCYAALRESVDAAVSMTLPGGLTVETESAAFTAQTDYDSVLRYRGAAALELMDEAMDGGLVAALGNYARACAYGIATRADLLTALNEIGSGDWTGWLSETLQGIGRAG